MDENTDKRDSIISRMAKLWKADEILSLKNIHRANLPSMLIFPLAIILLDLRFLDQEMSMFGLDSILLMTLAYSLAWLVSIFIKNISRALRIFCAVSAFALLIILFLPKSEIRLGIMLIYHFSVGICMACGFFAFCFSLNNSERFIDVLIVSLYYAFIDICWNIDTVRFFLEVPGIIFIMIIFVYLAFKANPELPLQKSVEKQSYSSYIVFAIYFIYFIIDQLNVYIDYEMAFTIDSFVGLGSILAVLTAIVLQLFLNRSTWHLWNLFMVFTILGLLIIIWSNESAAALGSVIFGAAGGMGYITVMYLLGCVGRREASIRFFKIACIISFLENSLVTLALDKIYALSDDNFETFAFGFILFCFLLSSLLVPALYNRLFAAEWSGDFHKLDMAEAAKTVEKYDRYENLGLTPREKEVATLILQGLTGRQISAELGISFDTVKFHTKNLYKKLGVGGRAELFSRFGIINKEKTNKE